MLVMGLTATSMVTTESSDQAGFTNNQNKINASNKSSK